VREDSSQSKQVKLNFINSKIFYWSEFKIFWDLQKKMPQSINKNQNSTITPTVGITTAPPVKTISPALIEQLKPGGTIVYKDLNGTSQTLIIN